jgi:hypothetical protein
MHATTSSGSTSLRTSTWISVICLLGLAWAQARENQEEDIVNKLQGFDAYMEKVLKDWNGKRLSI